jgi:hypothetical protein
MIKMFSCWLCYALVKSKACSRDLRYIRVAEVCERWLLGD